MMQTMGNIRGAMIVIAAITCCAWGSLFARDAQPTLDELLHLPPVDAPRMREERREDASGDAAELEVSVQRLLDQQSEQQAPSGSMMLLEEALGQMDAVSRRLGRQLDPGVQTQRVQQSILLKLDQVIAAARRQQSGASGSSGSSGSSGQPPSPRQSDAGGAQVAGRSQGQASGAGIAPSRAAAEENRGEASPGQVTEVAPRQHAIEEIRREWGALPPRLRDELSQGLSEDFSPVYRDLTEAYYRRLAEEQ